MAARIILISGPAGAGKTSVSRIMAECAESEYTAHLHSDDFYRYIRKGYIDPWRNESGDQNETVVEAVAASAKRYTQGGYEVYVDGIIGPWFLGPWLRLSEEGLDVRYVVLRPNVRETVMRAMNREKRKEFPLTPEIVTALWNSFSDLGEYEAHAVDTGGQTVEESARYIQEKLRQNGFRIFGV